MAKIEGNIPHAPCMMKFGNVFVNMENVEYVAVLPQGEGNNLARIEVRQVDGGSYFVWLSSEWRDASRVTAMIVEPQVYYHVNAPPKKEDE